MEEDLEEGITVVEDNKIRGGVEAEVGGVGDVPEPLGVRQTTGEGEGGESNDIRTIMEYMEVVEEGIYEGETAEADEDDTEAEGGGIGGDLLALEATGILTQDTEPGGTKIIDVHNGFKDLSRLSMRWTVYQHWTAGASFEFNCYSHRVKLLFC